MNNDKLRAAMNGQSVWEVPHVNAWNKSKDLSALFVLAEGDPNTAEE